jgi:hypothetical protein
MEHKRHQTEVLVEMVMLPPKSRTSWHIWLDIDSSCVFATDFDR